MPVNKTLRWRVSKSLSLSNAKGVSMLDKFSDEQVVEIMQQLVAEAILEGRLQVGNDEIEEAKEIGLSLGFVEEDKGLALGLRTGIVGNVKREIKRALAVVPPTSLLRLQRVAKAQKLYRAAADTSFLGKAKTAGRGVFNKLRQGDAKIFKGTPLDQARAVRTAGALVGGGALATGALLNARSRRPLND
jgi:hypothetical protein